MDGRIGVERKDGVLRVVIDRPAKRNALTLALYDGLTEALARATDDPGTRAVLITGAGDAFTAGNDLNDFLRAPPAGDDHPVARFLGGLAGFEKPLVAAVNGVAVGIGTTLLLHCDLAYASEAARFQLPFVNLGLVPEAASSLLLPRAVGDRRAAELLLLGEPIDAATAERYGLVNAVLPADRLTDAATAAAVKLAAKPPEALRLAKALLRPDPAAVRGRMAVEMRHFVERLGSPEAREAVAAFLEKRPPDFHKVGGSAPTPPPRA